MLVEGARGGGGGREATDVDRGSHAGEDVDHRVPRGFSDLLPLRPLLHLSVHLAIILLPSPPRKESAVGFVEDSSRDGGREAERRVWDESEDDESPEDGDAAAKDVHVLPGGEVVRYGAEA